MRCVLDSELVRVGPGLIVSQRGILEFIAWVGVCIDSIDND